MAFLSSTRGGSSEGEIDEDLPEDLPLDKTNEDHSNEMSLPPKHHEYQKLSTPKAISQSEHTSTSNSFPQFIYNRQQRMSRSDEGSVLGRAVLTTPHRRMPAVRIAAGPKPSFISPSNPGPIMTATPIFVTKFSLCETLGCALRDLRVIDQFSTNQRYSGPAFLARSNCVIVNVGHVRAIVMKDQVLIFLPELTNGSRGKNSSETDLLEDSVASSRNIVKANKTTEIIERLVEALVTHLNSIYHSSYTLKFGEEVRNEVTAQSSLKNPKQGEGKDRKRSLMGKQPAAQSSQDPRSVTGLSYISSASVPPFELVVIEALLGHVCSFESSKVNELIKAAKDVLDGIAHNFNSDRDASKKKDAFIDMQAKLGELLPLKNKVDELEAKCSEVAGAIAEVLKNDEDMAAMRLSEKNDDMVLVGDPNNLHVEVELLFEDYLLQMDEVILSLRSVQNSVRNTEEVVEIELGEEFLMSS